MHPRGMARTLLLCFLMMIELLAPMTRALRVLLHHDGEDRDGQALLFFCRRTMRAHRLCAGTLVGRLVASVEPKSHCSRSGAPILIARSYPGRCSAAVRLPQAERTMRAPKGRAETRARVFQGGRHETTTYYYYYYYY